MPDVPEPPKPPGPREIKEWVVKVFGSVSLSRPVRSIAVTTDNG